ncbi:MAG TPA: glycoside hydrolase family 172 protein [Chthonomonadales bacterium]|nr:glycoside hydrolase family 172 protein [Chthonomonadales bacterium]
MLPLPIVGVSLVVAGLPGGALDRPFDPLENLARPDLLPVLRTVRVASDSSYDRTGGNDDGFSGRFSYIRREGDTLVIADLQGPGVVQRIWTPTPTDEPLEFTFDGESAPRLRAGFHELFLGGVPGLPLPLVSHGAGGFTSYVPIPYARSLKVAYRGPRLQFYQINHARLPAGTSVESFTPDWTARRAEAVRDASELLAAPGTDLSARMVTGAAPQTTRRRGSLRPGRRLTLFQSWRGGRILGIRLRPAEALAGKDRAVTLAITFDGSRKPNVLCPAGDFFGYSWGEPAMRAAFAGTDAGTAYVYLPMPYDRSAKVELISERTAGPPIDVEAEVVHAAAPRRPEEGRFYAVWRRESPTTRGKPFTFVEAQGRGHVVAAFLQAQGPEPGATLFFEGDDQATIDGELRIHGTGSEDFFNGGWYDVPGRWDARRSLPLSGCLDYKKHLGRTGGYRFMVPDPIVYDRSILLTIEHAPERNDMLTDYASVTYLYADQPPTGAGELPPLAQRAVSDPDRSVIAVGWTVPVNAFSFQNATLAKRVERIGQREVRFLSLTAEGSDIFGPHCVEVLAEVAAAGTYRVTAEVVAGPDQGVVQLVREEAPAGPRIDLRAQGARTLRTVELGRLTMRQGQNPVLMQLRPSQAAQARFALDIVTLILERIP